MSSDEIPTLNDVIAGIGRQARPSAASRALNSTLRATRTTTAPIRTLSVRKSVADLRSAASDFMASTRCVMQTAHKKLTDTSPRQVDGISHSFQPLSSEASAPPSAPPNFERDPRRLSRESTTDNAYAWDSSLRVWVRSYVPRLRRSWSDVYNR
ncbi:hypothetical protein M231_00606 [Tremella mesenterica]|uniref:Uncharacterized protein n=1 Tax=Tremella mesenterica TaxID=5217 RepID=A0A4V1M511_TREME|nr:hypothetical protein M231_00606 [Tremella mesenterica]